MPRPVSTLPLTAPPVFSKSPPKFANYDYRASSANPGSLTPILPSRTISILVPAAEDLYPTVTLHSPATAVMCRFSAQDLIASSREYMGAPVGAAVYAVDGSVIFAEDE